MFEEFLDGFSIEGFSQERSCWFYGDTDGVGDGDGDLDGGGFGMDVNRDGNNSLVIKFDIFYV